MPELGAPTPERQTRRVAMRLAVSYMTAAIAWIVLSDWAETLLDLSGPALQLVNTGKGILFVLVTGALLYSFAQRFLTTARVAHDRYRHVQEQLRLRERSIEQAYIDVLASVTGGKLILMWPDDVADHLGEVVLPAEKISSPSQLSAARAHLGEVLAELGDRHDEALLAANEGLSNALKYAGGGEYEVRRTPFALQVVITDHGSGIDFSTLPRATLITGYSTKSTLGIGFTIMFDAAERVLLATQPGLTTLVLEFSPRVT